jgi:hypothetical protein
VPHSSGGPKLSNNMAFVKLLQREWLSYAALHSNSSFIQHGTSVPENNLNPDDINSADKTRLDYVGSICLQERSLLKQESLLLSVNHVKNVYSDVS